MSYVDYAIHTENDDEHYTTYLYNRTKSFMVREHYPANEIEEILNHITKYAKTWLFPRNGIGGKRGYELLLYIVTHPESIEKDLKRKVRIF